MRVEPSRNLVIGSGKGVRHGEGQAILGKNEGICHKKASEPSAHLTPVKRENTQIRHRNKPVPTCSAARPGEHRDIIADLLIIVDHLRRGFAQLKLVAHLFNL